MTITKIVNGEKETFEVKLVVENIGNITRCYKKSIPLEGGENGRRTIDGIIRR